MNHGWVSPPGVGPLPGPAAAQGRNQRLEFTFAPVFPQWASSRFPGHARGSGRTRRSAGPGLAPFRPAFLRGVCGALAILPAPLLCSSGCSGLHHVSEQSLAWGEDTLLQALRRRTPGPSSGSPVPNVPGRARPGAARSASVEALPSSGRGSRGSWRGSESPGLYRGD